MSFFSIFLILLTGLMSCTDDFSTTEFSTDQSQVISTSSSNKITEDPIANNQNLPNGDTNENTLGGVNSEQNESIHSSTTPAPETVNQQQTSVDIPFSENCQLNLFDDLSRFTSGNTASVHVGLNENLPTSDRSHITYLKIAVSGRDTTANYTILKNDFPNLEILEVKGTGTNVRVHISTDIHSSTLIYVGGTGTNNHITFDSQNAPFGEIIGTGEMTVNMNINGQNAIFGKTLKVCGTGNFRVNLNNKSQIPITITGLSTSTYHIDSHGPVSVRSFPKDGNIHINLNGKNSCPFLSNGTCI